MISKLLFFGQYNKINIVVRTTFFTNVYFVVWEFFSMINCSSPIFSWVNWQIQNCWHLNTNGLKTVLPEKTWETENLSVTCVVAWCDLHRSKSYENSLTWFYSLLDYDENDRVFSLTSFMAGGLLKSFAKKWTTSIKARVYRQQVSIESTKRQYTLNGTSVLTTNGSQPKLRWGNISMPPYRHIMGFLLKIDLPDLKTNWWSDMLATRLYYWVAT